MKDIGSQWPLKWSGLLSLLLLLFACFLFPARGTHISHIFPLPFLDRFSENSNSSKKLTSGLCTGSALCLPSRFVKCLPSLLTVFSWLPLPSPSPGVMTLPCQKDPFPPLPHSQESLPSKDILWAPFTKNIYWTFPSSFTPGLRITENDTKKM